MRLRLRLIWLVLSSFWRKPMGLLDESVLNLRVLPNDIDISKITNDRFVALMDLGRMDAAFRIEAKEIGRPYSRNPKRIMLSGVWNRASLNPPIVYN